MLLGKYLQGNFGSLVLIHKVLSVKTHPLYGILASHTTGTCLKAFSKYCTLYDVLQHSDKQELMVKNMYLLSGEGLKSSF